MNSKNFLVLNDTVLPSVSTAQNYPRGCFNFLHSTRVRLFLILSLPPRQSSPLLSYFSLLHCTAPHRFSLSFSMFTSPSYFSLHHTETLLAFQMLPPRVWGRTKPPENHRCRSLSRSKSALGLKTRAELLCMILHKASN